MRITIQEENLSVKPEFEIWADTFGGKIHRYHAENGIFAEQPFRSSIEDSNQIITSCGVGSHHHNAIFEIKTQTLLLGAKILILHAKRYRKEQKNTMLWPYVLNDFA